MSIVSEAGVFSIRAIPTAAPPDENLYALVETARTLGVYNPATGELPNLPASVT